MLLSERSAHPSTALRYAQDERKSLVHAERSRESGEVEARFRVLHSEPLRITPDPSCSAVLDKSPARLRLRGPPLAKGADRRQAADGGIFALGHTFGKVFRIATKPCRQDACTTIGGQLSALTLHYLFLRYLLAKHQSSGLFLGVDARTQV
jgi:hypothetical protein